MLQLLEDVLDYKNVSVISFGIRNISKEEIPFLKKKNLELIYFGQKIKKWNLKNLKV